MEAAQKHCRARFNSYILKAAVEMQRIHVMSDGCSYNDHSPSINVCYRNDSLLDWLSKNDAKMG